jgi:hypothetical protein
MFDYPLTIRELWKYATQDGKITDHDLSAFVQNPPAYVSFHDGYFFLKGRRELIEKRNVRQKISEKKILFAEKSIAVLARIPSILFIGLSGSLAVKNAREADDIDLFIITKKHTLWQTRLLVILLLQLSGMRRKRLDQKAKNKICTNMFMDEGRFKFTKKRQDIFTAREIVQMMPIFDRDGTYARFLKANTWVKKYLPNALERGAMTNYKKSTSSVFPHFALFNLPFEVLAKRMQLWYMRRHRTSETVTDTMLAFHPIDYRLQTLKRLQHLQRVYEKI